MKPIYPLYYEHTIEEVGVAYDDDGNLAFVDFDAGFATTLLHVSCIETSSGGIEIAAIAWASAYRDPKQDLKGPAFEAAKRFVMAAEWDYITDRFHERASPFPAERRTKWQQVQDLLDAAAERSRMEMSSKKEAA